MPDYRDFAESFFSPAIWENEGKPWLVIGIVVIIVIGTLIRYAQSTVQTRYYFYALTLIGVSFACTFALNFYIVDSVNQNVAKHNIAEKYNTSSLKSLTYNANERTITALYTNKRLNLSEEATFGFIKGNNAPFLIKRSNTEENFRKIENDLFKPAPQIFTAGKVT